LHYLSRLLKEELLDGRPVPRVDAPGAKADLRDPTLVERVGLAIDGVSNDRGSKPVIGSARSLRGPAEISHAPGR